MAEKIPSENASGAENQQEILNQRDRIAEELEKMENEMLQTAVGLENAVFYFNRQPQRENPDNLIGSTMVDITERLHTEAGKLHEQIIKIREKTKEVEAKQLEYDQVIRKSS